MNRCPLRVEARRDETLSRWLWLVKWALLIPHYLVLAVLWVGFVVLTLGAYLAVLFTGRYPAAIRAYDLGVLRWSWRVNYYGYQALGTDRYPPPTASPSRRRLLDPQPRRRRGRPHHGGPARTTRPWSGGPLGGGVLGTGIVLALLGIGLIVLGGVALGRRHSGPSTPTGPPVEPLPTAVTAVP